MMMTKTTNNDDHTNSTALISPTNAETSTESKVIGETTVKSGDPENAVRSFYGPKYAAYFGERAQDGNCLPVVEIRIKVFSISDLQVAAQTCKCDVVMMLDWEDPSVEGKINIGNTFYLYLLYLFKCAWLVC